MLGRIESPNRCRIAVVCISAVIVVIVQAMAAAPRPVIRDGTVKTPDGDLLRAAGIHISKSYSAVQRDWLQVYQNIVSLRDDAHMNSIRISMLDVRAIQDGRPDRAYATIAEALPFLDKAVDNCDSAGIYAMINYHHFGGWVYDGSEWDIRHFWSTIAPRYRDRTHVFYDLVNEPFRDPPTNEPSACNQMADLYKSVRQLAPKTLIVQMTPVEVGSSGWASFLKNTYAPVAGISWGTDYTVWGFHCYDGTTTQNILAVRNAGVPILNTEFSYHDDGLGMALDGHNPASKWLEKNGISWTDWTHWNRGDCAQTRVNYLVPDAVQEGYVWWKETGITAPKTPLVRNADFLFQATTMMQVNGRAVNGQDRQSTNVIIVPAGTESRAATQKRSIVRVQP